MKTADIYVVSGATDTLPADSDPMYQSAVLSLVLRKTLENMNTVDIAVTQPEVSDFSTFKSDLSTYLSDAYDRETEIINNGVSSIVANLPDVLSIGAAFVSGGATEAGACILNIVLGKLLGGDSGARGDYRGGETAPDMTEVVEKLEEVRAQIAKIFNEWTINILYDQESGTFMIGPP